MATVGFIGVGVMGGPMARNLLRGGHHVQAFDLAAEALEALAADGAVAAGSAAEAAGGADAVITMLPAGEHVKAAVFGTGGVVEGLAPDALYIDMSTILPAHTDEIGAALKERGVAMIDAPVGRPQSHAVTGTLLIMVGGAAADVERARPLLDCMGDTIVHCGPLGMGARMKVINNYQAIALNVLTAETLTLAEASGLDVGVAREVMGGTVAGRGHMATTYPDKVLKGDLEPGFMVDLAHKDLGLALELAAQCRVPTTLGAVARQVYARAQTLGYGRRDWTSIYPTVRELAGLPDAS